MMTAARLFFTTFLLFVTLSCTLSAAVRKPASCSFAHVNAAVRAASPGDTVLVPAGNCNWGSNTLQVSKQINLLGAGSGNISECDETKSTCIYGTGVLLSFFTSSTHKTSAFRVSGLYLSTTASLKYGHLIEINGSGSGWRMDRNYFHHGYAENARKAMIAVNANSNYWTLYGLIDNNIFKNVYIYAAGGNSAAEHSWKSSAQWGKANALFIENNIFDGSDSTVLGVAIDSQNGGRITARYNTFKDMYIMAHSACQKSVRGARSYEIYNNEFRNAMVGSGNWGSWVDLRAGSAVIINNFVTGHWTPSNGSVKLDNRRSWFDPANLQNSQCTDKGIPAACCTGSKTGTCTGVQDGFGDCNGKSPYDTNINNPANDGKIDGYICLDQPGAGTGKIGKQTSDPIYIWGNTAGKNCLGGANKWESCTIDADCPGSTCSARTLTPNQVYLHNNRGNQPYHIVAGRDYITGKARPDWKPYTCPHPLAGLNGKCTSAPGTKGYNVRAVRAGDGL